MSATRLDRVRGLAIVTAATMLALTGLSVRGGPTQVHAASTATCQLGSPTGAIKHVIEITFDNVHFRRDDPNVPSDIEQMPNLYNFLVGNGIVLNNNHTPLISHTGTDILTTLTGVYPDRHGQPVSNTYMFYGPDGVPHTALSFAYWTDKALAFDGTAEGKYNMLTAAGQIPPAPWVPFTRAGCNVGGVGTANIELERVSNVATVYGVGSPEATEAADMSDLGQAKTTADFIGVAVHCAHSAALCASANHGQPDVLPNEPGGYVGFNGLFGHTYAAPLISSTQPMTDLDGYVIANSGPGGEVLPGFPGFNGTTAAVSLSYVAAMQEHGVPVTYAYISAAHEKADTGLGAGDPTYEQNLRNYDRAFGTFFNRLAKDGINKSNTLFVVSADENDHFVGAGPLNPGCNGVTVPCHYDPNKTGNVEVALDTLLAQHGITTPFGLKGDSAPDYYVNGNPAPNDASVRAMERAVGALVVTNPLTGRSENLTQYMADRAELNALHMVTSDPLRTPTFTQFELPDYAGTQAPLDCSDTATVMLCPGVEVWSHGDIQPQITTTWLAMVGPGVRTGGIDNKTWSDHTDIRPTLMALTGLRDDYRHDGRVLFELLNTRGHDGSILDLAEVYKQINAPVGAFGMATVRGATTAIESGNASDDSRYSNFDAKLTSLTNDRNALALKISNLLEAVAFDKANASRVQDLIDQAEGILARANQLAG